MVAERQLAALTHGRYLVDPPEGVERPPLLVGFHGYGENAERHLESLRRIPGASKWLVAAVQALHPFYDRKANEVVASWMTRLDRELTIADNLRYVGDVVAAVKREFQTGERLVYAGFSQGVAMAYRAAAGSGHPCHGVIALAGDFPPELKERELSHFPPVLLGRGSEERWYDEKKLAADLEHFRSRGIAVETCLFSGGHEWTAAFYEAAGSFLARWV